MRRALSSVPLPPPGRPATAHHLAGLVRAGLGATLLLALLLAPAPGTAGPWPRERGSFFVSTTVEAWESALPGIPHYYGSIFVEYGLTERLTLGHKYAMGSEAGTSMDLRLGIGLVRDRPYTLSLEVVLGERESERFLLVPLADPPPDATARFGSVGLGWGRGLTLGARGGWVSVEGMLTLPLEDEVPSLGLGGPSVNLDTTFGVTFDNGWKALAQVFAFRGDDGQSVVKLAPGVAIPLGARMHVEIGARLLADDLEGSAVALGLWQEF